jgi:soluble lytic murein transglycosylase-like protein
MIPQRVQRWEHVVRPLCSIYGLDPLLVLAVMDRESMGGWALTPKDARGTGDGGHGKGLMQIDDRAHPFTSCEDDTGRLLWQQAPFNVHYACMLLARLLLHFKGAEAPALAAYNAGQGRVSRALAALPPGSTPEQVLAACDAVTTGGDYASDVLARREAFRAAG